MSIRVALVTTTPERLSTPDQDTAPLLAALRARGAEATTEVWHDTAVDWARFDLIVLRSPWDYPQHMEEFLAWLDGLDAARVVNPPALVRWNFDKRYLLELAARDVPIIPTQVAPDLESVRLAVAGTATEWVVIKPTVSAASQGAHLLRADHPAVLLRAQETLDAGKEVIVEPAVPELRDGGERAIFLIAGEYSHAAHKGPLLAPGGGLIGGTYTEVMTATEPTGAEIEVARRASAAVAAISAERGLGVPLYERFDVVTTEAWGPVLIEAELFEPQYFFRLAPGAVDRVADAIVARARPRPED